MYLCDLCNRTYKYKRNLTRHISENHLRLKYWKCAEEKCSSTFSRRGYLLYHLCYIHKYPRANARSAVIKARCVYSVSSNSFYEDVSSDKEIMDIIAEAEIPQTDDFDNVVQNFNLEMFSDSSSEVPWKWYRRLHMQFKVITLIFCEKWKNMYRCESKIGKYKQALTLVKSVVWTVNIQENAENSDDSIESDTGSARK